MARARDFTFFEASKLAIVEAVSELKITAGVVTVPVNVGDANSALSVLRLEKLVFKSALEFAMISVVCKVIIVLNLISCI